MADSEEPKEEFKYWAFISYSHSDEDWARWLHRKLETYRVPRRLVGKKGRDGPIPARAYPIFRDRDELPGSAKLTDNIEDALRRSRYLIVLCSPNAVVSKWVDQEIRIFKSLGREERVLCMIIDGEPNAAVKPHLGMQECFPDAIRYWVDADRRITDIPTEPIAADARRGKDGRENSALKIVSGILGVPYGELRQRDQERKHKQMLFSLTGAIAIAIICFIFGVQFYLQRNAAIRAEIRAEDERKLAEEARDKERIAKEAETQAKNKEIAAKEAEKKARTEAEDARDKERAAKEAESKAKDQEVEAHRQANEARDEAVRQKTIAQENEARVRRILSSSDLTAATRLVEENNAGKALAYLSRAMRYDPNNVAVISRLVSLLSQRNWPLPPESLPHSGEVKSVQFSPDGKLLATFAGDWATLWDATTRKVLFELKHAGEVNFAAFSHDGKQFVTAARDNVAQVWNPSTGEKIGGGLKHDSWVQCVRFSHNGKLLVTGTLNHTAQVWDIASGNPLTRPLLSEGPVRAVSFNPDDTRVLIAAKNTAQVWDIARQERAGLPMNHEGGIYSATFSPSGKYIATASGDKTARIWNADSGTAVSEPLKHDNWVNTVRFSPDERFVLTASSDGTARVFEAPRGMPVLSLRHDAEVVSARFSPNMRWIATASADSTAQIWDAATGKPVIEPLKHNGPVTEIAFSPNGRSLATASADHTAKIWNIINGKPAFEPLKHSQPITAAVFSPDGTRIATASADRTARIWDFATGRPLTEPLKHDGSVLTLKFNTDGKYLLTGSEDGSARIWNSESGEQLFAFKHESWVNAVALSPDEKFLATGSEDRTARIWDLATGRPVTESLPHNGSVKGVAFTSDGKNLLTTSLEKSIRLWETATGKISRTLEQSADSISEIKAGAISPDGKWIAAAYNDKTVMIWDSATGEPLGHPLLAEAPINSLAFAPASAWAKKKWLLTMADKSARVWDIETAKAITEPIEHSEKIVAANFNSDGNFFVTAFGKSARVWESSSGKPISEPLQHLGNIRCASFSADGNFLITGSADQTARVWLIALHGQAPGWLGELADAIGNYSLDDSGAAQRLAAPSEKLNEARTLLGSAPVDSFSPWGKWFLADRADRPLFAGSSIRVSEYVQRRVNEGTESALAEALEFAPDNGLALAKRAFLSKYPAQSDFFSRLAQTYEPDNAEVLWRRASILQEQKLFPDAYDLMTRALSLDPRNFSAFGPDGADVVVDAKDGITAKGWLPKGWLIRGTGAPLVASVAKVTDPPTTDVTAIDVAVTSSGANFAVLTGPRALSKKGGKISVEGWVRSANKSDLNVALMQVTEPQKTYLEQTVHTTPEWKPFKLQLGAPQDLAVELVLRQAAGSSVQIGGISLHAE